ncbi:hypothetical protein ACFL35_03320 [Candidatus Riflebacteria bacterium]
MKNLYIVLLIISTFLLNCYSLVASTLLDRAEVQYIIGNDYKAKKFLLRSPDNKNPRFLSLMARIEYRKNSIKKAKKYAKKLLQIEPDNSFALFLLNKVPVKKKSKKIAPKKLENTNILKGLLTKREPISVRTLYREIQPDLAKKARKVSRKSRVNVVQNKLVQNLSRNFMGIDVE